MILGEQLLKTNAKISELVVSWAMGESSVNNTNKKELTRPEFRKQIKKWLGDAAPSVKEIDGMFNELDLDGGGTLDLDELTQAIKTMREQARKV